MTSLLDQARELLEPVHVVNAGARRGMIMFTICELALALLLWLRSRTARPA